MWASLVAVLVLGSHCTAAASLLAFTSTYSDAAVSARAALRLGRDLGRRRLKVEIPVLQPDSTADSQLLPGNGANTWPGGAAQSHRLGLQPVAAPLLRGYNPRFLGMIDVGIGVWSLAGGSVTAVSNVADLSFDSFARLCDGEFGAAPTRSDHALWLINPRLTSSKGIGQPWQRKLRERAVSLLDETEWQWAYRCKPIAARGGLASAGVVLSSELDGARGSKVYTMEGLCVATSDEPTAFYASDGSTVEARRALAKHAARTAAAAGGAERSGPRP